MYIKQPRFPNAFHKFLYTQCHPWSEMPTINIEEYAPFSGQIYVYHSAVTQFYVIYVALVECIMNASIAIHFSMVRWHIATQFSSQLIIPNMECMECW